MGKDKRALMADWFTRRTSALLDRLDVLLDPAPPPNAYDILIAKINMLIAMGQGAIWEEVSHSAGPNDSPESTLARLEAAMEAHNIS